jgi:hypothetical protein
VLSVHVQEEIQMLQAAIAAADEELKVHQELQEHGDAHGAAAQQLLGLLPPVQH